MDEHAVGFMLQQQAVVCDSTGECLGFFEGACVYVCINGQDENCV